MVAPTADVADPSDWLNSSIPKVAPVESALRCQVCKDFFDTPMITSCSHTFCSLCIRRCLTSDGRCPVCRSRDQELRLRRNWTVEELVDAYQAARPSLSLLATLSPEKPRARKSRGKRKLDDTDFEDDAIESPVAAQRTKTMSQSRQQVEDSTGAGLESPSSHGVTSTKPNVKHPDDGLAACPICSQRMKEEAVFLHLDTHNATPVPVTARGRRSPSVEMIRDLRPKTKPPERLPQMNYSLMKDSALRKKLSELGIPNTGSRNLLTRRHAEWVNIVNANADSSRPKSKREMLRELETWDRSTGRSIASGCMDINNPGSVMSKEFDGTAWNLNHRSDFQDLVTQARHTRRVANSPHAKPKSPSTTSEPQDNSAALPTKSISSTSSPGTPLDPLPPVADAALSAPSVMKEVYSQ
ncbi:MAG: hypothetical protein Q9183_000457 [Haloplaca sp. 2 TL-2023]